MVTWGRDLLNYIQYLEWKHDLSGEEVRQNTKDVGMLLIGPNSVWEEHGREHHNLISTPKPSSLSISF